MCRETAYISIMKEFQIVYLDAVESDHPVRVVPRIGRRYPEVWKKNWGTVTLSAVGMFGKGPGWGIPPSSPSLCWITVGGIGQKREDVDGQIALREYLSLTVSVDHNMIDGGPAARFAERLKELIESAYGLIDAEASNPFMPTG